MSAIIEISPLRKRNARLSALAFFLSWAFVFGLLAWLNVPPEELQAVRPVHIWLGLLVFLVVGAMIVLSIGGTIARMDKDHHGRSALTAWIAAGLLSGLISGLSNLPFLLQNESRGASFAREVLWFGGPLVGYVLAFRRNPITAFSDLQPTQTPPWAYRLIGGFFQVSGILGLLISAWIVSGIITQPGFQAPWGAAAALPASLSAIAFGWTFSHYNKPYDREAIAIGLLGLLFGLAAAAVTIAWLIWG